MTLSGTVAIGGVVALTPARLSDSKPSKSRIDTDKPNHVVWFLSALAIAALISSRRPTLFVVMLPAVLTTLWLLRSRQAALVSQKRSESITAELPVIVELLALAISAGESPASAIARVARASNGPIGLALTQATVALSDGGTLVGSLEGAKRSLAHPSVERCFDAIILGYERGTSLNDVLHAQALDSREHYRRALIEHSARAEIAMMIPVVFLIMPVTIVFALFPSMYSLTYA